MSELMGDSLARRTSGGIMDNFMEEVVVKKHRGASEVLFIFVWIVMILSALLGFMTLQSLFVNFNLYTLIMTVIPIGIAALLFWKKDTLRTEYEYTFTNGDLDFAQVFNNQKRKSLGTMRVKNVEAFGPVDGEGFRKLVNMPGIKRKNWFLNRDANLYYFYYQKESNKTMIILEPSEELVGMIRKYLPHGTYRA